MNACLTVTDWLTDASYCRTTGEGEVDVIPVLQNSCDVPIRCKVCGDFGGVAGECQIGEFAAGDSQGGWATQWVWCDADGIVKACTPVTESPACVEDAR